MEEAEKGKKLMPQQMYKIKHEIADGNRVAWGIEWIGTPVVPLGRFRPGDR